MKKSVCCFRILYLWIALVLAVLICSSRAEAKQESWQFEKVELFYNGRGDERYGVMLKKVDANEGAGSSVTVPELQLIMQHFGVHKPEDLVGKVFAVDELETPWTKLNELAVLVKNKGNYQAPNPEELYDRAARALAKMELPDFSDVTDSDIHSAFRLLWTGKEPILKLNIDWLNNFREKVYKYSNGKVTLLDANMSEFHAIVRGSGGYFKLINKESGEVKRLILPPGGSFVLDVE